MNIERAEQMALSLMRYHGVHDYKFELMQPRKKFCRAGQCSWVKKVISLQPYFIECNYPIVVKRTILHEIAHALTPKQGHNKQWKKMARSIGDDGGRCYGKEVKKRRNKKLPL
jgi:predicted SprT family Zn-dependent metalloprotease